VPDMDNRPLCSGYPSMRCLQKALTTFIREKAAFVSDIIFVMIDPAGNWV
jgi:hypothetical protein